MARPIDDDMILGLYTEGKFGRALATGAAVAGSLMGNPSTTMADTTYQSAYQDMHVLNADTVVKLWSKYYQTSNDPVKEKRAHAVLADGVNIPREAMDAIKVAIHIFGGDKGISPNVLSDMLVYTGDIESGYKTKVQGGGGPARSYWQVEPSTALDHINTGSGLLGGKFQKTFAKELETLKTLKNDERGHEIMSKLLEQNDGFAASMAAMNYVRRAHNELSNIQNR
tara:strand:- start:32647 stop:33324 length:678 start_codon:yes stop_codon:yes gene_type:complete